MSDKAVVIKSIAPLKQRPQYESELADEVLFGSEVDILEEAGDWIYIHTAYNYKGYLEKSYVTKNKSMQWEEANKAYVIASFADVLSKPKYSANCFITLTRGALIALTGEKQEQWAEVLLPEGEKGWVRAEGLLGVPQRSGSELRQSIVETALMYLGTQYRWGGKTPMGIDCSGLSFMAYLLNGIVIPRDSGDQLNFLTKISRKETKPGDLLFFPGHVAIYIGEDKFVHATGSGAAVRINSLNSDSKLYRKDLDEKYICTGTVL